MNSFGRLLRIHVCGESHGPELAVIIDGCPAGIPLEAADFSADLVRRQAGASGTTARREADQIEIGSGVYSGHSSGAPILLRCRNCDPRSGDYAAISDMPRPGHADLTARQKFVGWNDPRGGGHFSGRLTLLLAAAGVVAKKIIAPILVTAKLLEAGGEADIGAAVARAAAAEDSLGGIITCRAEGVPAGLGEPFFDSLESLFAHLFFAIPGVKGVEFGAGFAAARMSGSEFNDVILDAAGKTASNHCGGINGGISNGNVIECRIAVRPPASIPRPQKTFCLKTGKCGTLTIGGRHDLCFALRVPVLAEATLALVLADLLLLAGHRPHARRAS